MKFKILFAFFGILLFFILFFIFSALKKDNKQTEQTTTFTSLLNITTASETVSSSALNNENTSQINDITSSVQTSTQIASTASATQTKAAQETPMPSGKEEIVKYYVEAINNLKQNAKSAVRVYNNNENYDGIKNIGNSDFFASIAESLFGMFMVENTERVTFDSHEQIVKNFPPANSEQCKLTPEMIENAEISDLGDKYEIKLKSISTKQNPDINPSSGGGILGTAFNILEPNEITDPVKKFPVTLSGVQVKYFDGTIKCTVEKSTKNIVSLETYLPCIIHIDSVKALIKLDGVDIGLAITDKYEIRF